MSANDRDKTNPARGRKKTANLTDEEEEREYRRDMRRLNLLQRTWRIRLSVVFVFVPFSYLIGSSIGKSLGYSVADLNWVLLVPFMAAGISLLWGFDFRNVLVLFGNFGAALSRLTPTEEKKNPREGDEEENI